MNTQDTTPRAEPQSADERMEAEGALGWMASESGYEPAGGVREACRILARAILALQTDINDIGANLKGLASQFVPVRDAVERMGAASAPEAETFASPNRGLATKWRAPVEPVACEIFEYDGAFKCLTHGKVWGAITNPDTPCAGATAAPGEPEHPVSECLERGCLGAAPVGAEDEGSRGSALPYDASGAVATGVASGPVAPSEPAVEGALKEVWLTLYDSDYAAIRDGKEEDFQPGVYLDPTKVKEWNEDPPEPTRYVRAPAPQDAEHAKEVGRLRRARDLAHLGRDTAHEAAKRAWAEVERLRKVLSLSDLALANASTMVEERQAEVERLRVELERMTGEQQRCQSGWNDCGDRLDRAEAALRKFENGGQKAAWIEVLCACQELGLEQTPKDITTIEHVLRFIRSRCAPQATARLHRNDTTEEGRKAWVAIDAAADRAISAAPSEPSDDSPSGALGPRIDALKARGFQRINAEPSVATERERLAAKLEKRATCPTIPCNECVFLRRVAELLCSPAPEPAALPQISALEELAKQEGPLGEFAAWLLTDGHLPGSSRFAYISTDQLRALRECLLSHGLPSAPEPAAVQAGGMSEDAAEAMLNEYAVGIRYDVPQQIEDARSAILDLLMASTPPAQKGMATEEAHRLMDAYFAARQEWAMKREAPNELYREYAGSRDHLFRALTSTPGDTP